MTNQNNYFKRLCVMIRTIKSLSLGLPSYGLLRSHRENSIVFKEQYNIDTIGKDYQLKFRVEDLVRDFSNPR